MRAVAVAAGAILVIAMVSDAVSTLVVTQGRSARWRPTRLWYFGTWRTTRAFAIRAPTKAANVALDVYPAASLLGLLVVWLVGLLFGWAIIYWGLHVSVDGSSSWGTLFYYSGTSLLTPAFGTAHGTGVRILTLLEVLTGLGTIALLISYLPALYGAYSKREARLLTLDDPAGSRITPVRVIALHSGDGNLDLLYRFFAEWEMWTAEVLESHVSYPMLALFRSQHMGQSWITALGVVTDAATLACATIDGADTREPYFMYRRGRRAVANISDRLHLKAPTDHVSWLNRENFQVAWDAIVGLGLPLRDKEDAWRRLRDLREPYGPQLQELIDYLLAPHGFWGHSAEDSVAADLVWATAVARNRPRAIGHNESSSETQRSRRRT
jgi:hypothetical protein